MEATITTGTDITAAEQAHRDSTGPAITDATSAASPARASRRPRRLVLPMPIDHLDGRHVPSAHLVPFVPRVRALLEDVMRLQGDLGRGEDGDPWQDPPDSVINGTPAQEAAQTERWAWERQLRRVAADLARLVAGPRARHKEGISALEWLRAGDHRDQQVHENIIAFIVRLTEDESLGVEREDIGGGLTDLGAVGRRLDAEHEAAYRAAHPSRAAEVDSRRARWEEQQAERREAETRRRNTPVSDKSLARFREIHTAQLADIDREVASRSAGNPPADPWGKPSLLTAAVEVFAERDEKVGRS